MDGVGRFIESGEEGHGVMRVCFEGNMIGAKCLECCNDGTGSRIQKCDNGACSRVLECCDDGFRSRVLVL